MVSIYSPDMPLIQALAGLLGTATPVLLVYAVHAMLFADKGSAMLDALTTGQRLQLLPFAQPLSRS